MHDRKSYLDRLELEVRQWAAALDALQVRIEGAAADDRAPLLEELGLLRVKHAAVEESIRALKGTGEEVWETLRPGVDDALREVTRDIRALGGRLRRGAEVERRRRERS